MNFKNIEDVIPIYYHLTLVSAYIEVFGWMTQCALLLLRIFCVADFNVRIMQIQEKIQLEDDDDDLRVSEEIILIIIVHIHNYSIKFYLGNLQN